MSSTKKEAHPIRTYEEILKTGTVTLSKPFKFEDEPAISTLLLPLSKMTGIDIITVQDNFETVGNQITGPVELNKKYQAFMAAHLAGVKPEFIMALPVADFNLITLCIQRFLLGSG